MFDAVSAYVVRKCLLQLQSTAGTSPVIRIIHNNFDRSSESKVHNL